MKKLLPLLTLLFLASGIHAQNWNPLKPVTTNYFTNVHGYLKAIQIDSITAHGTDLHYHPYRRAKYESWGWYSGGSGFGPDTIGSWIGRDVVRKPGGIYQFSNHWDDTIVINALASPGDSWMFYQDSSSRYYTAEVTSVDTMTVLGNLDSVKRILIRAYNGGNLLTTDSFDNTEIVLSKANGVQTIMELYYFPFNSLDTNLSVDDYYFTNSMMPAGQWGSSTGTVGKSTCLFRLVEFDNPPASQFIDWNVGDIYQYDACFVSMITGPGYCDYPWQYRLDTIISKTVTPYGVEYVRKGWWAARVYANNTNVISHYNVWPHQDTIFFADSVKYLHGMTVPEKWIPSYWYGGDEKLLSYYLTDTVCGVIRPLYYRGAFVLGLGGSGSNILVAKVIGLISASSFSSQDWPIYGHENLIYSVRNGVPCGSYFFPDTTAPVSLINTERVTAGVKVYPNPAQDNVTIEASFSQYSIELVNSIGQTVFDREGCNGRQQLALDRLSPGVYVLRLESSDGVLINRKLVVQ